MNILQRLVDRISPKSLQEEERKTDEYEQRRQARLIKVRASTEAEISVPEDFAAAMNLKSAAERRAERKQTP